MHLIQQLMLEVFTKRSMRKVLSSAWEVGARSLIVKKNNYWEKLLDDMGALLGVTKPNIYLSLIKLTIVLIPSLGGDDIYVSLFCGQGRKTPFSPGWSWNHDCHYIHSWYCHPGTTTLTLYISQHKLENNLALRRYLRLVHT